MKALVLAAGFGTRLKHLTHDLPKALITISKIPLIFYSLYNLKEAGINSIIINLHHKGEKIKDLLANGNKINMNISYSEEEEILGTGGAIKKVEHFFKGEHDLLVINSDLISNINLNNMIDEHKKKNAVATLGVSKNNKKDLFYNKKNKLLSISDPLPNTINGIFTGIQVLSNEIFKHSEEKFSSSIDTYKQYIKENKPIYVYELKNEFWFDLGTLENNQKIELELREKHESYLEKVKKFATNFSL